MLLSAPFPGPCFPTGLCSLRPLGSDAGLSSEVRVHTCSSLQCTHHPPTPLHPVWDFLACSTLTLVICVGLFCFLHAFIEATLFKKIFFFVYCSLCLL